MLDNKPRPSYSAFKIFLIWNFEFEFQNFHFFFLLIKMTKWNVVRDKFVNFLKAEQYWSGWRWVVVIEKKKGGEIEPYCFSFGSSRVV